MMVCVVLCSREVDVGDNNLFYGSDYGAGWCSTGGGR